MSIRSRLTKLSSEPLQFPSTWKVPGGTSSRADKRRKELDMWRQWKESNESPKHLEPLLRSLKPTIDYRVNMYAPANVYKPALRAKANNLTINALRRYDPTKNSLLNSHVTNHLKGLHRWTGKHQNVARITEDRISLIGKYKAAKAELEENYGFEPSSRQIAQQMGVDEKTVRKIEQENRPDLVASAFDESPFVQEDTLSKEILSLIEFDLSPEELKLWQYLYGLNGKPRIVAGGKLAAKLGWSQSKVSQTRKKITQKVEHYSRGLR